MTLQTILYLACVLTTTASDKHFQPFTQDDKTLQAIYTTLHIIDWSQTLQISKQKRREGNPILGEHPSQERVNVYFSSGLILHYLFVYCLPQESRHIFQVFLIGIEGNVVRHNYGVGLGFNF